MKTGDDVGSSGDAVTGRCSHRRANARSSAGSVTIEMVFAFVPFMLVVLGIIQMMLLENGKIVTKRAANAAVRAAVVILDDDPKLYGGAPRNSAAPGSPRMRDIKQAAMIALAAVDPPRPRHAGILSEAIAVPPTSLTLPALLTPGAAAGGSTDVTLVGGTGLHDRVTARVQYNFDCLVPLAAAVMCNGGHRRLLAEATLTNQGAPYVY